jgi:hypothetical protein
MSSSQISPKISSSLSVASENPASMPASAPKQNLRHLPFSSNLKKMADAALPVKDRFLAFAFCLSGGGKECK